MSVIVQVLACVALFAVVSGEYENVNNVNNEDHVDTRCSCKCPETGQVDMTIENSHPARKIYISTHVNATDCDCEHVVQPVLNLNQAQMDKFCPRCDCKHEKRSLTIIKVVIIIVLWVVCILIVYMLFLLALEPLIKGRAGVSRAGGMASYQPQADEPSGDEQGEGGTPLRTYGRQASGGRGVRDMVGQLGHSQDRWKRQVEIQRRNIYDRHTMLN
jgi:hypothetical protein